MQAVEALFRGFSCSYRSVYTCWSRKSAGVFQLRFMSKKLPEWDSVQVKNQLRNSTVWSCKEGVLYIGCNTVLYNF